MGSESFRDIAQEILHDTWNTDKTPNRRSERKCIARTAAATVREDVRSYIFGGNTNPAASSLEEIAHDMVQETLKCFVDQSVNERKKQKIKTEKRQLSSRPSWRQIPRDPFVAIL